VPRSKEPSAAAQRLIQELALRKVTVSPRMIEDWAARGLAPAPTRRSLGRGRGTASEYPPGAADQYAAVAAVMRRGRSWQVSVLKLLARGHLPTDENLVRQALRELLAAPDPSPGEDPLDYAERVAGEVAAAPVSRPFIRAYERNLRRSAQLLEPGTRIGEVVMGVLATLTRIRAGEAGWSYEALAEMLAAHGVPVAGLPDDDRARLAQFAETFVITVLAGPGLAQVAAQAPLPRIRAAIPQARADAQAALAALNGLPQPGEDIIDALTVFRALIHIRIEDLGGDEAIAELARQGLEAGTAELVTGATSQATKPDLRTAG